MTSTYRLLAIGNDVPLLTEWFRALPDAPEEVEAEHGTQLYFRSFGGLVYRLSGNGSIRTIDIKKSPLVSLFLPRLKRGVLWTAAEVHFLPARNQFPQLDNVNRQFRSWVSQYEVVFSRAANFHHQWDYYLAGNYLKNHTSEIFGLPEAMRELRSGRYFVSTDDTNGCLDTFCRELRKRGVQGLTSE